MKRNIELLERVMQYIDDHPEEHDQDHWIMEYECGTTACFAGWAVLLSGYKSTYEDGVVISPAGKEIHAQDAAINLLGLTENEANVLFDGYNTRAILRLMVKDLVNGENLRSWLQYLDEA